MPSLPLTLLRTSPLVLLVAGLVMAFLSLPLVVQQHRRFAIYHSRPLNIEETLEWEVATFLRQAYPGERVFAAAGSVRWWMTAIADVPQFGGGFAQGVHFPQWWPISHEIPFAPYGGKNTSIWLAAYGVDLVVSGGENSRDAYPVWNHAERFDRIFPVVWASGDDRIYRVNRRNRSLAHVVPEVALVRDAPLDISDSEQARRYVEALEAAPEDTKLEWLDSARARIDASPATGDVISVQIAFDKRWEAHSGGGAHRTAPDGLGQLVIYPRGNSRVKIDLIYSPSAYVVIITGVAWVAWLLCLVFALGRKLSARLSWAFGL